MHDLIVGLVIVVFVGVVVVSYRKFNKNKRKSVPLDSDVK